MPNANGATDRDAVGRFAEGNRAARGHAHPHARSASRLKGVALDAVTDDDLRAIMQALVRKARKGDIAAAREVLDRCLGRPATNALLPDDDGLAPISEILFRVIHSRDAAVAAEAEAAAGAESG